ncbi:A disintegrin and metalloproteinase with thrombospondin motifs 14 [Galemys pyrenaicus]|uniref:A disintegrin and metalloproteinase with thrombospondin motifs 14 n=1 Tax=Galemys pyrenaicus TaxID=202257 RepID=A0A8J5ZV12_GALPY|nr:A disintegrin and metalloproteinase with thrombospondin motifs 14 [Galemys pyrenaicus]
MAPLRALLSCLLPLHCALCAARGSRTPERPFSGKLRGYGLTVPCSTDFQGRFLSHVVSGPAAASTGSVAEDGPPASPSHSSHPRVARSPLRPEGATLQPSRAGRSFLYFNVTVFGAQLHLRLQPNRRLVVPGALVEWQEDFRELFRQPLWQECVYTGSITGMPGATVAISNCDGLLPDSPPVSPLDPRASDPASRACRCACSPCLQPAQTSPSTPCAYASSPSLSFLLRAASLVQAGLIRTDSTDYFIEPLERGQQDKEATGRTHVVYRREVGQHEWAEPRGDLHNEGLSSALVPGEELAPTCELVRSKPSSYAGLQNQEEGRMWRGRGRLVAASGAWPLMRSNLLSSFLVPAFGLGDLPNLLGLVGDQLGEAERKRRHAKPGSYSIEVLLVVDDSVVRFHGKEHVQNYVLTLMNIVDEIYHDESLGVHINIALVRLIMVGYRQSLSLIERGNPSRSLEQVCRWAHSQQRQDPGHAEHHDHVVFLTRQNFGPSGYAPVTGMCHPLRSCALNHEDGFSSAFVVAHETGHVLGMEHDGQGNGCADETSLGSVMAPLVQAAFHRFHWSRCSKLELSRYLPSYDCLLDDPFAPAWPRPPELPGTDYSMDEQCRFDFGSGYHTCSAVSPTASASRRHVLIRRTCLFLCRCPCPWAMCQSWSTSAARDPVPLATQFRTFEPCKQLWCSHPDNPYFCKTKKGPPLDGTECAPGKWCFKGHCIWKSLEQTYGQDGGWSSWTKFGSCSRSCGGGVRSRSRSCDNPLPAYGGRLCPGPMFQYQICNSEECPGPYEDFRAQQCAKRNSYYLHQNAKHSWVPYEPLEDAQKCELICQSEDTGDVVFMDQVVHDGTRCSYRDPYSVCARGECVPVGCDKEVGSMKTDDKCGVCGGDNSHCRTVKGTLGKASKQAGALKLVQIPAGARHIQIELLEKTPYRIAVKNQVTGSFILNPKSKETTSRTFTSMGLEWEYSVQDTKENLKTSGPLPEAIAVLVLPPTEGGPRSSLAYKYVIHEDLLPLIGSNNVLLEETDTYEWALKSWAPCTKACGGGIQFTKYGCRRRRDQHVVQRHLCDQRKRPKPIRRRCNQHPCPQPAWVTEEWSACSRSCGKLGVQTRGVQCLLPLSNGTHKAMPAKTCSKDRPEARRPCLRVPCPAQWRTGAWSQCSATCGEGIQQRQVVCRTAASLRPCEGDKPDSVQVCILPACEGDLQNSTMKAVIWELVTPEGQKLLQPGSPHPVHKISSTEPCAGDRSPVCQMDLLDRHCFIPGYHRLCCESCTKKTLGLDVSPDPRLSSLPPLSTPGSPVPGPSVPPGTVETSGRPAGSEGHQHSSPSQQPEPLDTSTPVTQHPSTVRKQSPRAFWGTSPGTSGGRHRGWTGAPVPASGNKEQLGEDPEHTGIGVPATSPGT